MSQLSGGNDRSNRVEIHSDPAPQASDLLKKVLETTLLRGSSSLSAAELEALKQVAAEHGSEPLPLEQVAHLLVSKFVEIRFGNQPTEGSEQVRKTNFANMSKAIAETLCNDPTSSQRLTELWSLLQKSAT